MRFHALTWIALTLLTARPSFADPVLLQLDRVKTRFVGVTESSGALGFLGKPHAISASRWFAALRWDRNSLEKSSIELVIPAESLEVDTEDALKSANISREPPAPEEREALTRRLLGPDGLDAAKFPSIRFSSESIQKKSEGELTLKGKLTLHGTTRDISFPVASSPGPNDTLRFTGSVRVRLKDYGISLPSAGFLRRIGDEAEIRFEIQTQPETVFAKKGTGLLLVAQMRQ